MCDLAVTLSCEGHLKVTRIAVLAALCGRAVWGAVKQTKQSAMTLGVMTLAKVKVVEESSVQQAVQTVPGCV